MAQMTPEGWLVHEIIPTGREKRGGIVITVRDSLKEYCIFHHLLSVSFDGALLKIKRKYSVLQIVFLYQPPSSRQTKCNTQTFITELSDHLEQ